MRWRDRQLNGTRDATDAQSPVAVPVAGTALLLIDVINDLAFDGSDALVAQAEAMAAPLARLKRRATAAGVPTIYINETSGSGGLIFAGPSRIAPHAPRRAAVCRGVSDRRRATTSY